MAGCLQRIPSGNESCAEGENDEIGIPNYSRKIAIELILLKLLEWKK